MIWRKSRLAAAARFEYVVGWCCWLWLLLWSHSSHMWRVEGVIQSSVGSASTMVVVTAAYGISSQFSPSAGALLAVDNLMTATANTHIVIFGDAESLQLLQQRWPKVKNQRIYVERRVEDFVSFRYLGTNNRNTRDLNMLLSAERFFMVTSAMYALANTRSLSAGPITGAVWIDIDTMSSQHHISVATGFPDSRKLSAETKLIVASTVRQVEGLRSKWLLGSVIAGGAWSWNMLHRLALTELNQTLAYSGGGGGGNDPEVNWYQELFGTRSLTGLESARHLLFLGILYAHSNMICDVPGRRINFLDTTLTEESYLLYYFSYSHPMTTMESDIHCKP
jgi:hypothetical protein